MRCSTSKMPQVASGQSAGSSGAWGTTGCYAVCAHLCGSGATMNAAAARRDTEEKQPQACALLAHWRMMYGEHKVLLDPQGLLMDSYPMVCHVHRLPKMIVRPYRVVLGDGVPHSCGCSRAKDETMALDSPRFKRHVPGFDAHLLHYYAR